MLASAPATSTQVSSAAPQEPEAATPEGAVVELSIVLPCLNEADTLATCITKARRALATARIAGEVIVADNGSSDGSQQIAESLRARLIHVPEKGYGNALMAGIAAARGHYVLMADADDSYDLLDLAGFVRELRAGAELVQGCRFPSGGGQIKEGAMPLLHRWWGNPGFSWLARWWFRTPVNDIYCGMRAFTKELYERLGMRCTGMEFATEMIIKASRRKARIAQVPITLHPDGRRAHRPHLKTFRDGWRTLRFFMMFAPRWIFLEPGKLLMLLGIVGYALALPGLRIGGVHFSSHTLVIATLMLLLGLQSILFAVGVKTYAISQGLLPPDRRIDRLFRRVTLERCVIVGAGMLLIGAALLAVAIRKWWIADFGDLDYERTMRWVVPGAALVALGFQTILAGFWLGILSFFRR